MKKTDREFINSLAKGLNLLMCFTKEHPAWNLSQIAKENDMNLPTAKRYLHTYTKMGFMTRDESDKTFQLTPKVLRLGAWIMGAMEIKQRLLHHMKSLRNDLNVTCHCAVIEGNEIIALERIRSSDVVNLDLSAGSRLPIHATSLGKAIVAFMEPGEQERIADRLDFKQLTAHTITDKKSFLNDLNRVKDRGYAIADQELSIGLKTMAVPIFDTNNHVEGSLGISYPLSRANEEGLEDLLIKRLFEISQNA